MTNSEKAIGAIVSFVDIEAGLTLMTNTFGFQEGVIFRNDHGVVEHAELWWGTSVVMPAARKAGNIWGFGPVSMFLSTSEPDALHAKAVEAGLEVVMPPTDQEYGSREFAVRDADDNLWVFGTYVAAPPTSPE